MGKRRARTTEMLPSAMQIQNLEPQGTQSHTEEILCLFLCVILCPLWLRFFGVHG